MRKRWAIVLAPIMILAAACSSSTSDSGSSGSNAPAAPVSSADLAGATKLPSGTVGVLQIQAASEIITRLANNIKTANTKVGWKTEIADGKGDPSALAQAMTNFVSEKVDAIVTLAVDAPAIAPQIKAAKAAGIPVIAAAVGVSDPNKLFTATFAPDISGYVSSTVAYLKKKYSSGADVVQVDIPEVFAAHGFITAIDPALKTAGFPIKGNANGNAADIVNTITSATTNVVQANPSAKILLSCCDFTPPIQIGALKAANRSDILLVGRFDNLSSLKLFASGANMILGAANVDTGSMNALDAVYAMKASKTAIPTDNPQGQYKFDIIDKTNVPASGKFFYDPAGQITTFVTKWSKEYSK